jgi:small subunit ribosomal protein S9
MSAATSDWWGLGRRKKAVARVKVKPGSGSFLVNGRPFDSYFDTIGSRLRAKEPLVTANASESYDVECNVNGGGRTGQADAVRMGLSRALKLANPTAFDVLRTSGMLTRDSRAKERKHYGRRGARRGFQWCKR